MTRIALALAFLGAVLAASPAQAATDYCHLRHVPVRDCDRDAQVYRSQAGQIPQVHLDMVASIEMWGKDYGLASWPSMTINLPRWHTPTSGTLSHEVAHLVAFRLDLNTPYAAKFWPGGKRKGRTTDYGETNSFEDLAECSAAIVIGKSSRCSSDRISWLRDHMFDGTKYE